MILYTTWPSLETAETFAAEAVAERLTACANILSPAAAIYRWEGAVQQNVEVPMILKTTADAAGALRDLIVSRHPYATPCVMAIRVEASWSAPGFLSWIGSEVSPLGR